MNEIENKADPFKIYSSKIETFHKSNDSFSDLEHLSDQYFLSSKSLSSKFDNNAENGLLEAFPLVSEENSFICDSSSEPQLNTSLVSSFCSGVWRFWLIYLFSF